MAALAPLDVGLGAGVLGAFSTRSGGTSAAPWDTLNLARHVGDEPARVRENRDRLARWGGVRRLHWPQQVHGPGVRTLTAESDRDVKDGCDALVTAQPGIALAVLAADCLPALLSDPRAGVVAAAHAGRQGLVTGVLQATLAAMAELGSRPGDVVAALGPTIGGCCYELPDELAEAVAAVVPMARATTRWGTASVDVRAGAESVLRAAGVTEVHRVGGCTVDEADLFSYRRDGVTGRHAGLILRR